LSEEPNYLAQAFKSQYNLIGLGTALGFAILSGTALPLLIAAGVEMIVLPLVAGNDRFQRLTRARLSEDKEIEKQERVQSEAYELLRAMPEAERRRYRGLEGLAHEIRRNYQGLGESSRLLLDDLSSKLEFLLAFYLRTRHSLMRYEQYFATTDPNYIQERIAMLEHEVRSGSERVKQVKTRTKAVLEKRLERYHKALENKQLVDAQTETVQEVLQLLRDQSYSMRDPRTITEQLDGLVSSAEETERGVRDMEQLLALDDDALSGLGGLDADAELADLRVGGAAAPPSRTPVAPPLRGASPSAPAPARKKITD
jgi:DNA repair exonuclease SbcCD ATPase subunit